MSPAPPSVGPAPKSTMTRDFAGSFAAGTFESNEIAIPAHEAGPVSAAASWLPPAPPTPAPPDPPPEPRAPSLQAAIKNTAERPSTRRVIGIMGPLAVTSRPKTGSNVRLELARTFARARRDGQLTSRRDDPRLTGAETHAYRPADDDWRVPGQARASSATARDQEILRRRHRAARCGFRCRRGRDRRPGGRQRRRQIDADEGRRRHPRPRRGDGQHRRPLAGQPGGGDRARRFAGAARARSRPRISTSARTFCSVTNRRATASSIARSCTGARLRRSSASGAASIRARRCARCRRATSSAWRSRARCRSTPRSCCSTSRRPR